MIQDVLFYTAFVFAVISTGLVVLSRNPLYAVLYFVLSLFSVAIIFFLLGAPFAAMLEIIVYAGAVMVLFLFVVMLLNLGKGPPSDDLAQPTRHQLFLPAALAGGLLIEIVGCLFYPPFQGARAYMLTPAELGMALYQRNYLGVELASIVLLIGIVGGLYYGRGAAEPRQGEGGNHGTP